MKTIFALLVLTATLTVATPANAQYFYDYYGCNCDYAYNRGYYDGSPFGYGAPLYGGYGGFGRGGYFGGFGPVYGGFYGQPWYGGTGSLWGDVALGVTGALLGGGVYGNAYYPYGYYGF